MASPSTYKRYSSRRDIAPESQENNLVRGEVALRHDHLHGGPQFLTNAAREDEVARNLVECLEEEVEKVMRRIGE